MDSHSYCRYKAIFGDADTEQSEVVNIGVGISVVAVRNKQSDVLLLPVLMTSIFISGTWRHLAIETLAPLSYSTLKMWRYPLELIIPS